MSVPCNPDAMNCLFLAINHLLVWYIEFTVALLLCVPYTPVVHWFVHVVATLCKQCTLPDCVLQLLLFQDVACFWSPPNAWSRFCLHIETDQVWRHQGWGAKGVALWQSRHDRRWREFKTSASEDSMCKLHQDVCGRWQQRRSLSLPSRSNSNRSPQPEPSRSHYLPLLWWRTGWFLAGSLRMPSLQSRETRVGRGKGRSTESWSEKVTNPGEHYQGQRIQSFNFNLLVWSSYLFRCWEVPHSEA